MPNWPTQAAISIAVIDVSQRFGHGHEQVIELMRWMPPPPVFSGASYSGLRDFIELVALFMEFLPGLCWRNVSEIERADLRPGFLTVMLGNANVADRLGCVSKQINQSGLSIEVSFQMCRRGVELKLDLSHCRSAPGARLGGFPFESDWACPAQH